MKLTAEKIMKIIDEEIEIVRTKYSDAVLDAKNNLGDGALCDRDYLELVRNYGMLLAHYEHLRDIIERAENEIYN